MKTSVWEFPRHFLPTDPSQLSLSLSLSLPCNEISPDNNGFDALYGERSQQRLIIAPLTPTTSAYRRTVNHPIIIIIIIIIMSISNESLKSLPPQLTNEDASMTSEMLCSIRYSVPHVDPVTTRCDHIFCQECIEEAMKHSDECPNCRSSLHRHVYTFRSLRGLAKRIWESIPVQCPGGLCQWSGTMGNYKAHISRCGNGPANRLRTLEEEKEILGNENESLQREIKKLRKENFDLIHEPNETNEILEYDLHFLQHENQYLTDELDRMKKEDSRKELTSTCQRWGQAQHRLLQLETECKSIEEEQEMAELIHTQNVEELETKIDKLETENMDLRSAAQEQQPCPPAGVVASALAATPILQPPSQVTPQQSTRKNRNRKRKSGVSAPRQSRTIPAAAVVRQQQQPQHHHQPVPGQYFMTPAYEMHPSLSPQAFIVGQQLHHNQQPSPPGAVWPGKNGMYNVGLMQQLDRQQMERLFMGQRQP